LHTVYDTNHQACTPNRRATPDNHRVRRAQMDPMLRRVVVELQQHLLTELIPAFRHVSAVIGEWRS
jgi:hypothetical protein